MLSVIIPTEGVEQTAVATLGALVPGAAAGLIREVLLVDRAGNGVIERVADVAGCRFLPFEGPHAAALAAGARQARAPWLMFLRAGAVLDTGWIEETTQFIQGVALERTGSAPASSAMRARPMPTCGCATASIRSTRLVAGPRTDQGLADRARPLFPARRTRAGRPPLRGEAAAPARPLLAHAAAQPDRDDVGLTRSRYLPKSIN